jgi:hypothetical protein
MRLVAPANESQACGLVALDAESLVLPEQRAEAFGKSSSGCLIDDFAQWPVRHILLVRWTTADQRRNPYTEPVHKLVNQPRLPNTIAKSST